MGILSDLHRQLHAASKIPAELMIDDERVTELSVELANMSYKQGDFSAIERSVRGGQSRIFGLPLRVRAPGQS